MRITSISVAFAMAVVPPVISAQTSETSLVKRLDGVEQAVRALEKQVADLNSLLRSALPPPPFVDVMPFEISIAGAPTKGAATAKIVLIEYSDFECPYCGRHAQGSYRDIERQYVDTGKITYVFRHLPLDQIHPSARKAAEAAECAREQGKFWQFHDRLFANQMALSATDLTNHARAEKLDVPAFQACLNQGKMKARIDADHAEAAKFGVTSTPEFLIGELNRDGRVRIARRVSGAHPFQVFQAALDKPLDLTPTK